MKILLIALFILLSGVQSVAATGAPDGDLTDQLLEKMSITEVNRFIDKYNHETEQDLPKLDAATIKNLGTKGIQFDWNTVKRTIWELFF